MTHIDKGILLVHNMTIPPWGVGGYYETKI